MIEQRIGDLLDQKSGHIVHCVNAQGVMGAGIALAIKNKYPDCYKIYKEEYDRDNLYLGNCIPYYVNDNLTIWNLVGQREVGAGRRMVNYEAIANGLEFLEDKIKKSSVPNILHFPLIGCGLAGGKWPIIHAIIDNTITCKKVLWTLS